MIMSLAHKDRSLLGNFKFRRGNLTEYIQWDNGLMKKLVEGKIKVRSHIGRSPFRLHETDYAWYEPVSYTHLDVYKRQVYTWLFLHFQYTLVLSVIHNIIKIIMAKQQHWL